MFGLGMQELVIILVIVVVIFGGSRLPQLGKGIGQAISNFKKGMAEKDAIDVTPADKTAEDDNKTDQSNKA
ncbi:MAG: twin-arginine translocase TatA/TatE family subunit [Dissulfurispiraceae bacterium]|jgi:sec-independent protein translocase protein TatA|nr:twin-arginine translocase TatA/TatE family subunit [Dissulfurispiraceae bacterium]